MSVGFRREGESSSPFEEAARSGNGNGLVHDPFADPEVFVEPAVEVLVFAGDLVRLETAIAGKHLVRDLHLWLRLCSGSERCGWCRETYVKPVERFMPARKAETDEVSTCSHRKRVE